MKSQDIKKFGTLDTLRFAFEASMPCTALRLFLALIQALLPTAVMALATANFVDTAIAVLNGSLPFNRIYLPLILLLITLGIITTIGAVDQLVISRISLSLQRKIKPRFVKIHAALDYMHIERAESWELISRVSRDPVKSIIDGFNGITAMVHIIVSVISVLVLIMSRVWWAALIISAFSVPLFWLSILAGRKNYKAHVDAEKFNRRTEYLDEVLTGRDASEERSLFGYTDYVSKLWYEQYEAGRKLRLKVLAKMFVILKSSSMLLFLVSLLIALTLIPSVIAGALSAGMYMGIIAAVFSLINNLGWMMSDSLEQVSKVREYMKDLTAFHNLSSSPENLDLPLSDVPEFNSLEFRNVRFKYPGGQSNVLDGMSFTLKRGRSYAFVGSNGAGKTTVTRLLTGLYSDYEGQILINGKELREYPAGSIKTLFSVVYQDFARYYVSLKENITLGDITGNNTDEQIRKTASLAGLDEIIAELKNGIESPLGKIKEEGQDLSGGQWQRIAIARSLLSRSPVKILDEPTAALDPISESRLYEEFGKLMAGKTGIFISHRLGSTKLADEILVISEGKVTERGTHNELLALNGQYARMFESQRSWYL
ncbi:MAG: ABC transporter ATP-binding protein/permease [Treponema sp.]|nr:ABC transporter ATP-binding protein/permease [Treponema sp.]